MQGFTYESAQFFNDKDEILHLVRIKKEFQLGSVYHPAGAMRLWSSTDENNAIEQLVKVHLMTLEEAQNFIADHFETVEIRKYQR